MRGRWIVAGCAVAGVALSAADVLTREDGEAFARKIVVVQAHADKGIEQPRATAFTQTETNSYLKFQATDLLPTGLTEPAITMIGQGRVSGRAVVDLDVVRRNKSTGGWFDPTSYLTGKLPVTAAGRIITADGKGRFELETASVSGVPIPKSFLGQMVTFFTRTADNPKGSSIDDTIDLPAKIRRIDVDQNRFTVHQ